MPTPDPRPLNANLGIAGTCFVGVLGGSLEGGFEVDTRGTRCASFKACGIWGAGSNVSLGVSFGGGQGFLQSGQTSTAGFVVQGGLGGELGGSFEVTDDGQMSGGSGFGGIGGGAFGGVMRCEKVSVCTD